MVEAGLDWHDIGVSRASSDLLRHSKSSPESVTVSTFLFKILTKLKFTIYKTNNYSTEHLSH